jgi:hypothetical protein
MLTDEELTRIYKKANGEDVGKAQPLTTQRIFTAMRAIEAEASAPLLARIAELEADAKRYLTIRNADMDLRNRIEHYSGPALDVFIDAAMKEQP